MTTGDAKISEGEVVHNFVARWNSMVERLEKQSCTIAKYREGNQRLRNELNARESDLTRIRVELSKAQSRHRQDIQAIDKVLQRCAERYDWCSTFNDEIEDINEVLTYPLSPRERVYIVEVPYLVTINGVEEVRVKATDPDAADRQCAWADYRKDYGVGESEMAAAHKAFMAGWKAAREGDQSGPLR